MQAQAQRPARWAPWWVYVVALVVTNLLRVQWLQPENLATWLQLVLGVTSMALVAAAVTAIWRAVHR
jgi:uncharacterized membrane protein